MLSKVRRWRFERARRRYIEEQEYERGYSAGSSGFFLMEVEPRSKRFLDGWNAGSEMLKAEWIRKRAEGEAMRLESEMRRQEAKEANAHYSNNAYGIDVRELRQSRKVRVAKHAASE